ncbi:MAG: hypothetical protein ABI769_10050 [Pseudomonadota bacterium]
MRFRIFLAILATVFAQGACGGNPDVDGLKAYAAPGYTIISREEDSARRIPTQIAMIDAVLTKLLKRGARLDSTPTYIFVVPQNLWSDYLQPALAFNEEFVAGRFTNYLLINNCRCDSTVLQASVYNQYAHLYLRTQFDGALPLWFEVGVARVAKLTEFANTRAYVGMPYGLYRGWMPIGQVLHLERTSPEYRAGPTFQAVHDESWALAYRMISEPAFGKQAADYLQALDDLKPVEEAVQSSFGMSVENLSKEMFFYTRGSGVKIVSVSVDLPPPPTLSPGRDMKRLESLQLIADVMFASEAKHKRLLAFINNFQKIAPDSPEVRVIRLRLAARDRDDAVIDWLLEKLESNLADPQVARGVGVALFERVRARQPGDSLTTEKTRALQQRALGLLDLSLRARPDDPEAAWAFGMLAASTNQLLGSALQRLLSASESAPRNADIAMATALVYEALQKPDKMLAQLKFAARFARSGEQRAWARQKISASK